MKTGQWLYRFFALHARSVNTPLTDFRTAHIAGNISCGLMYPWTNRYKNGVSPLDHCWVRSKSHIIDWQRNDEVKTW